MLSRPRASAKSERLQLSHLSLVRKQELAQCCVMYTGQFNRSKNKCKFSIVVLKINKPEQLQPIQFIVHVTAFKATALRSLSRAQSMCYVRIGTVCADPRPLAISDLHSVDTIERWHPPELC